MIGKTLTHYRINARLGAGGMGEVYGATDTKLQRDVAIQVLHPHLATPEMRGALRARGPDDLAVQPSPHLHAARRRARVRRRLPGDGAFPEAHSAPRAALVRETLAWLEKYLGKGV